MVAVVLVIAGLGLVGCLQDDASMFVRYDATGDRFGVLTVEAVRDPAPTRGDEIHHVWSGMRGRPFSYTCITFLRSLEISGQSAHRNFPPPDRPEAEQG